MTSRSIAPGLVPFNFRAANAARHEEALRPALIRALDDVKRGNDNIEKLLAELKAERATWSALKAYINVRSGQPTMSRACEDILDEMDRLERP